MSITTLDGSPQADFGPSIAQAAPLAGAAAVEEEEVFLGMGESANSLGAETSKAAESIKFTDEIFMLQ
jgi:hypothetical protein